MISFQTLSFTGLHRHKVVEVADEDLFVFREHLEELGYKI